MALALKILRLTPNTKNIVLGDMPEFSRKEGDLDDLETSPSLSMFK